MLNKLKSRVVSNIKYFLDKKNLNSTSQFDTFQFPSEFDINIYRKLCKKLYPDIHYSDDELRSHYKNYGIKKGKKANVLKNRTDFVNLIPAGKKILEIGPFFRPLTSGKNVSYFDVLNQEQLILRAQKLGFPNAASACPKIDFISPTGDLSIVNEKFDVVLSSHCIEHQPNIIKHFNDVEKLLKPGGFYFLLAPDKRYCFDHYIPESNLAQTIEVHLKNKTTHSFRSILECRTLTTHNNTKMHWQGQHGKPYSSIKEKVESAITDYKKSQAEGIYIDVHAWYFTPDSFRQIITALNKFNYVQLLIERIYPTIYKSCEFWVILKKKDRAI